LFTDRDDSQPHQVPMVLIEITFFSAFVYWITGLSDLDAGGRFGYFYFLLILYYLVPIHHRFFPTCLPSECTHNPPNQTMRSFVRMVCTFCPSLAVAQTITPPCLAFLLLFAGFIIPRVLPTTQDESLPAEKT
jgi:ABC-type multidrug transport system permease subunit